MELSFDIAEKYFWTWLDFWRFGPRGFAKKLEEQPESYLTGFPFFVVSLLLAGLAWAIAYGTLAQIPQAVAAAKHLPTNLGDPKLLVLRRELLFVVLTIAGVFPTLLVMIWPLRSPAGIKELLTAQFYATALLVVFAAIDATLTYPVLWIAQNVSDQQALVVLLGWGLGELLIFFVIGWYYGLSTICAFARMKKRRLLEGAFAQSLLVASLCSLLTALTFLALSIKDRDSFELGASLGFIILPLVLWWYLKHRVPKLRLLVQTEYSAY